MIPAIHSHYILDASVAAKWFTRRDEADREKALALRELHRTHRCRLTLPEFGLLEVLNAVRSSGRAKEVDTAEALAVLRDLQLQIEPLDWDLLRNATAVAWAYKITFYDAAYVSLAERLGFPVLTADEALMKKMKGHSIVLRLREVELPLIGFPQPGKAVPRDTRVTRNRIRSKGLRARPSRLNPPPLGPLSGREGHGGRGGRPRP